MSWEPDAKLMLLAALRKEAWRLNARPEQTPPPGDWRTWYVRGGRGASKTRTGSETLTHWITGNDPGEWAIIAPTFGDARSVCAESHESGILRTLGKLVKAWNRSEGVIHVHGGSTVYLDGANDGALRIQGKNLRGAWCDEVGLWETIRWDTAWNYSIQNAVRFAPGRIVATGTPKMGHPLVAHLLASPSTVETHMRTVDNLPNLDQRSIDSLFEQFPEGSTINRQELQGEYIEALEGSILSRFDWRWFDCRSHPADDATIARLPRFDEIVHSWDTAVKGKTSSDPVAGQVWGVKGPDRYLLRLWHGQATLEATVTHMLELRAWAGERWPNIPHSVVIETAANGADTIRELRSKIDGVHGYNPRDGGDKVARAFAASPALETGHCWLPGFADPDPNGRGYRSDTPPEIQAFVEEAAMFRGDMRHARDDQVDAWSQMVNWSRRRAQKSTAQLGRPAATAAPRITASRW